MPGGRGGTVILRPATRGWGKCAGATARIPVCPPLPMHLHVHPVRSAPCTHALLVSLSPFSLSFSRPTLAPFLGARENFLGNIDSLVRLGPTEVPGAARCRNDDSRAANGSSGAVSNKEVIVSSSNSAYEFHNTCLQAYSDRPEVDVTIVSYNSSFLYPTPGVLNINLPPPLFFFPNLSCRSIFFTSREPLLSQSTGRSYSRTLGFSLKNSDRPEIRVAGNNEIPRSIRVSLWPRERSPVSIDRIGSPPEIASRLCKIRAASPPRPNPLSPFSPGRTIFISRIALSNGTAPHFSPGLIIRSGIYFGADLHPRDTTKVHRSAAASRCYYIYETVYCIT